MNGDRKVSMTPSLGGLVGFFERSGRVLVWCRRLAPYGGEVVPFLSIYTLTHFFLKKI